MEHDQQLDWLQMGWGINYMLVLIVYITIQESVMTIYIRFKCVNSMLSLEVTAVYNCFIKFTVQHHWETKTYFTKQWGPVRKYSLKLKIGNRKLKHIKLTKNYLLMVS